MSVVIKAVRERWQVAGGELAARWGGFCLLTLLVFAGYALFIFSMTALNAGGLPNYYQRFRALDGIVDVVTLSMPLRERYTLVAGQPLLGVGYHDPVMGTVEGLYVLTLHAFVNLIVMSALIALYCLLLRRALQARSLTPHSLSGIILGSGGSAMGTLTAGAASVGCCGGAGASILLSLMGVGTGIGLFLAEHERAFGVLGLSMMGVNLWITAGWIVRGQRVWAGRDGLSAAQCLGLIASPADKAS